MTISKQKAKAKVLAELQKINDKISDARQEGLGYECLNVDRLNRLAYKAGYKVINIRFFSTIRQVVLIPKQCKNNDLSKAVFAHDKYSEA